MENEDCVDSAPDLPEPGAGNSIEEVAGFYQAISRKLDTLQHKTQKVHEHQDNPWSGRIQNVQPKDTEKEHTIGIIGPTGVGKSALINSLVNEERLVPTSCMQACTSAVIEIGYNRSRVHEYTATVDFMSRESWYAELGTFFQHFAGLPAEDFEDDASQAAIALARISAIYPSLDRDLLSSFTADELINRAGLEVLGTNLELDSLTSAGMYTKIQTYAESRERGKSHSNTIGTVSAESDMEYWPLVRRIRICTKAPILRTGCVIVDLPGTFDANPARAAVAKEYLAKCASVWIVVPIVRAVDDKVARTLLDESLRNQLRRDGTLDRVVLVLSKADQCPAGELKGKLKSDETLQAQIVEFAANRKVLTQKKTGHSNNIRKVNELLQQLSSRISVLDSKLDAYQQLLRMVNDGEVVHPPIVPKSKRSIAMEPVSRKQLKLDKRGLSALIEVHIGEGDDLLLLEQDPASVTLNRSMNCVRQDRTQPRIGATEIGTEISTIEGSLCQLHKEFQAQKYILHCEGRRLETLENLSTLVDEGEWYAYYDARNKYVRERLQDEFMSGVRELDRAELEARNATSTTPDAPKNFERQIDLPVFCVASQGFQKLCGRLGKENISGKFTDINQTGIPELMRYCIDIGERHVAARRAASANLISQLLTSLRFWISQKNTCNANKDGAILSGGSRSIQLATDKLIENIEEILDRSVTKIDSETDCVTISLTRAALIGEQQALGIVKSWRTPPTELHPSTYRAVLRYGGRFGNHNWIEQLLQPMVRVIDIYWTRAFNEAIPAALENAKGECSQLIRDFVARLEQNTNFICVPQQARTMFKYQFERLAAALKIVLDCTGFTISQVQMQANRVFETNARSILEPFFRELLASDSGSGVIQRYQQGIQEHMSRNMKLMFNCAALQVTCMLRSSREQYRQPMLQSSQDLYHGLRQDCQNLFATQATCRPEPPGPEMNDIAEVIDEIEELLNAEGPAVRAGTLSCTDKSTKQPLSSVVDIKKEPMIKQEPDVSESPSSLRSFDFSFVVNNEDRE